VEAIQNLLRLLDEQTEKMSTAVYSGRKKFALFELSGYVFQ
jgi:hypothetical protein